ncbi:MAG: FAD-dependent oxidoreductase [Chitinophagaceae bacterium]
MIKSAGTISRQFPLVKRKADLVIVGGGLSGVCCAITAARKGSKVILVQDRPVLGGNASSEVRLWVLGASSHMGNNNRWAREGGVIDELLVENTYRNPEGNAVIFDAIILDKVISEPNITLLLNTSVNQVEKKDAFTIDSVKAYCSQNQTEYVLTAPLFCDTSGDGVVGFLAGAAFRMGAESTSEFGEQFAPAAEYGELLGHSLYFYTKNTAKPVRFLAPSFALNDITKIPRYKSFNAKDQGCKLWWIEYGGRLDTVHDTEIIKWELWKVVYGVWDYIKNSGNFPESANMTLEWVGMIPGKRESRRFEGDYILKQQDIVEQRQFEDAVAYGGWSIDLHPADGVFSEKPGCNQWHSKGIYQIPFRCLYSKNINNLFLGGRIISASHIAFGSSRVMATSAYAAQAAAIAATICLEENILPGELPGKGLIGSLQRELQKAGQHIPALALNDDANLVKEASIKASSELIFIGLPEAGFLKPLEISVAQMLPLKAGKLPEFSLHVSAAEATEIEIAVQISSRTGNYTPDITVEKKRLSVTEGRNCLQLKFESELPETAYAFISFQKNPLLKLSYSDKRLTGILSVFNLVNESVSNYGKQVPPDNIGMDTFEFWCPQRRPEGNNLAITIKPGLDCFGVENIRNGVSRPTLQPNAWVADWDDTAPRLQLKWNEEKKIREIILKFDTDFDHPMESVLMTHPETVMPFCVRNYVIYDEQQQVVFQKKDNYQTLNRIIFDPPLFTRQLTIAVEHPSGDTPAAIFEVLCYS